MAKTFAVIGHCQHDLIDRWLLAGKSVRWVSAQTDPHVSFGALQRYRKKLLTPALRRMAAKLPATANLPVMSFEGGQSIERPLHKVTGETLADERVNPFIERAHLLWAECLQGIADAKNAVSTVTDEDGNEKVRGRDFSVLAPILNQAHRNLELFGKGAGYLATDNPAGNVQQAITVTINMAPAKDDDDGMVIDVVPE